jgi:hypothetical protein
MKRIALSILLLAVALCFALPLLSQEKDAAKEAKQAMFLPKPLDDDWNRWIVGQWEGAGDSDPGKGKGLVKFELGLNGQFLIERGEAVITEVNPEYLKKTMHATDQEIAQFQASPYKSLQIYTIDPKNGDIIGYLFDSLRCVATGKGKREANKETIEWQWSVQGVGTSVRITERIDNDRIVISENYAMPGGAIMKDRWEMTRKIKP